MQWYSGSISTPRALDGDIRRSTEETTGRKGTRQMGSTGASESSRVRPRFPCGSGFGLLRSWSEVMSLIPWTEGPRLPNPRWGIVVAGLGEALPARRYQELCRLRRAEERAGPIRQQCHLCHQARRKMMKPGKKL